MQKLEYQRQLEAAKQKAYHDAYIQSLRNRGYKIKYKKTFKDYIKLFIIIIIIVLSFSFIIQLPFVKNYFIDLYNNNEIIKYIINIFYNPFK